MMSVYVQAYFFMTQNSHRQPKYCIVKMVCVLQLKMHLIALKAHFLSHKNQSNLLKTIILSAKSNLWNVCYSIRENSDSSLKRCCRYNNFKCKRILYTLEEALNMVLIFMQIIDPYQISSISLSGSYYKQYRIFIKKVYRQL